MSKSISVQDVCSDLHRLGIPAIQVETPHFLFGVEKFTALARVFRMHKPDHNMVAARIADEFANIDKDQYVIIALHDISVKQTFCSSECRVRYVSIPIETKNGNAKSDKPPIGLEDIKRAFGARWLADVFTFIENTVRREHTAYRNEVLRGVLEAYATNPNCAPEHLGNMYKELTQELDSAVNEVVSNVFQRIQKRVEFPNNG
tara:strand:+ start:4125 stop:4733 length:609 start_codon:yes stop_codon:yes gene_type:complete